MTRVYKDRLNKAVFFRVQRYFMEQRGRRYPSTIWSWQRYGNIGFNFWRVESESNGSRVWSRHTAARFVTTIKSVKFSRKSCFWSKPINSCLRLCDWVTKSYSSQVSCYPKTRLWYWRLRMPRFFSLTVLSDLAPEEISVFLRLRDHYTGTFMRDIREESQRYACITPMSLPRPVCRNGNGFRSKHTY